MAILSKHWPVLTELSCYEIAHTIEPSCWRSWLTLSYNSTLASLKIYSTLYLIASIFRGDIVSYLKSRFLPETLRSSAFLASNAGFFLFSYCLIRRLTGRVFFLQPFLAGVMASYFALLIEKPSRRSSLASYVCMLSSECLFASLKDAGLVKGIQFGDVLIFGTALMWLSLLAPTKSDEHQQQDTATFVMKLLSSVPANARWRRFLSKIAPNGSHNKHDFHPSDISCLGYVADGFIRGGLYGLVLDLILLLTNRGHRSTSPRHSAILSSTSALLSSLLFLFRLCMCTSSRFFPRLNPSFRRSLSCFVSALSFMLNRKKATIPLWLLFKAAQLSCAKASTQLPTAFTNQFPLCLFAIATAYLIHQGCYEAHNIRPSYLTFLQNLTGGYFALINRRLLAGFQPDADRIVSTINHGDRHWWPRYDPSVSSQWTGPTAIPSFILRK